MKIAITDYTFPNLDIEEGILRPLGYEIAAWKEKRPATQLTELVADADAVITQFAPVTAEVIASMGRAISSVAFFPPTMNPVLESSFCSTGLVP